MPGSASTERTSSDRKRRASSSRTYFPRRGIEQVRHHRGVVLQRARVDVEAVHQLLRSMRDERWPALRQQRRERVAYRRVAQQVGVDVRGALTVREPDGAQRARDRRAVPARLQRERLVARRELAEPLEHRGGVAHHVDLDVEDVGLGDGRGRRRFPEPFEQPGHQGAEGELVEQDLDLVAVPLPLTELTGIDVERDVADAAATSDD